MNTGTTHDGLIVGEEYKLRLQWSWPDTDGKEYAFGLGCWLEFNKDANGRRWPYLVISLGRRSYQVGWLWGERESAHE